MNSRNKRDIQYQTNRKHNFKNKNKKKTTSEINLTIPKRIYICRSSPQKFSSHTHLGLTLSNNKQKKNGKWCEFFFLRPLPFSQFNNAWKFGFCEIRLWIEFSTTEKDKTGSIPLSFRAICLYNIICARLSADLVFYVVCELIFLSFF